MAVELRVYFLGQTKILQNLKTCKNNETLAKQKPWGGGGALNALHGFAVGPIDHAFMGDQTVVSTFPSPGSFLQNGGANGCILSSLQMPGGDNNRRPVRDCIPVNPRSGGTHTC